MTITEALVAYKELMNAMFSSPKTRAWFLVAAKYHHKPFEQAMRDLVKERHVNHQEHVPFTWTAPAGLSLAVGIVLSDRVKSWLTCAGVGTKTIHD